MPLAVPSTAWNEPEAIGAATLGDGLCSIIAEGAGLSSIMAEGLSTIIADGSGLCSIMADGLASTIADGDAAGAAAALQPAIASAAS
ncbi:MAG TPA: hypothetical protein VGM28_06140, partial [Candidatus Limnocylindrales bacterium]